MEGVSFLLPIEFDLVATFLAVATSLFALLISAYHMRMMEDDWTTLDRRVALIERSGGTPVITLCCAPDWMKGGRAGETDWTRLEVAPDPAHFGDFAALAAAVARRYPTVEYFQVWNELKGFFDPATNRWDAGGYTELYNRVYDAGKRVRPDARVGGPYVVLESAPADAQDHPADLAGTWGMIDQRGLDVVTYLGK